MSSAAPDPTSSSAEAQELSGGREPQPSPNVAVPEAAAASLSLERLAAIVRGRVHDVVFVVLGLALVFAVIADAVGPRLITFAPTADYWEHVATYRALLEDPWTPDNPMLATPASSPRFGPYAVLVALVATLFAGNAFDAMSITAVLNTVLFLAGIHLFFGEYFRDRRAPLFGLIVMFGSWWKAWDFSNVYQLHVYFGVAGYPSTTALALSFFALAGVVRALRANRPKPGLLAALTAGFATIFITHPLTAVLAFSGCFLLCAFEPGASLRTRGTTVLTLVGGLLLARLWPYFPTWELAAGGSGERSGWMVRSVTELFDAERSDDLHYFYNTTRIAQTLGLALLGFPVVGYFLIARKHWFIALGALSMVAPFVIHVYVPLPLGHRFILLAVFYLQVAVVWLLLHVSAPLGPLASARAKGVRWIPAVSVGAILAFSTYINVERTIERFERLPKGESLPVRYARKVADIAGPDAVVLGDTKASWPVPAFGPRVVAMLHENPLVPDERERRRDASAFFSSRTPDAARLKTIERYGVTHVLVRKSQERVVQPLLSRLGTRLALPGGYALYTVSRS